MTKNITAESFDLLLKAFSSDTTEAGIAYTKLRDSLVRFFELKGDFAPDEAADITLDRVAMKFSQNLEIDDLTKYSFGVARFIFLERLKSVQKEKAAAEGYYSENKFQVEEEEIDEFAIFRDCYGKLHDDDRILLQAYFADLPHLRLIDQRQRLTEKYNISLNNLRLKVFRLRQRLENCAGKKLK